MWNMFDRLRLVVSRAVTRSAARRRRRLRMPPSVPQPLAEAMDRARKLAEQSKRV